MSTLNLYSLTLAYSDSVVSNNPGLRNVDWKRSIQGLSVRSPATSQFEVSPGTELVIFDGSRATTIDGTTAFDVTSSQLGADLYRFEHTGGTGPTLRTPRVVAVAGVELALVANLSGTLVVTAATGTPFSTVLAGDELMIPGLLTGDGSSPFNAINQGRWTVLAVGGAGANMTLSRLAGDPFQGLSETVEPASNDELYVYSQAGVQAGDALRITGGFSLPARRTFTVESVTSKYVEVRSGAPLPEESAITPGATAMQFFANGKRFLQLEVDQEATLRINGVLGPELSPWTPQDPQGVAGYQQTGPVYSLAIMNRSVALLNALVITAE